MNEHCQQWNVCHVMMHLGNYFGFSLIAVNVNMEVNVIALHCFAAVYKLRDKYTNKHSGTICIRNEKLMRSTEINDDTKIRSMYIFLLKFKSV